MVGGRIIGLTESAERIHVHVADCCHYPKHQVADCPRPDTCCVYTDGTRIDNGVKVNMQVGDSFWWQCGICYWTPGEVRDSDGDHRDGKDYDIQLRKLGYSH